MADTVAMECPPTPENPTDFPATPPSNLRIREFLKSQQQNDSSSDEQRNQDTQSPPPNCSICLGRVKSKCFTDSCMHQFCFSCLLEWSKIKPECPLCKQTFKSIIHNVTSMDSYDEYKVDQQHRHVSWLSIPNTLQPLDIILSATIPSYRNVYRPEVMAQSRIFQLFLHESPQTDRFARMYPNDSIPPRHAGTSWRAYVYQRRLYAMPLSDINDRRRIITAEFYRDNPTQVQRLIPWLNRELISLVRNSEYTTGTLLGILDRLVRECDMTSRAFRRRIHIYILQYTDHFIHELTNFARSPYDMIGYDRNVMYSPMFDDEVINIAALSSSDENDVIHINPPERVSTPSTIVTENGSETMSITANIEPIASGSGGSSQLGTITTASSSSSSSAITERGPVIKHIADVANLVSTVIESSSDSSDIYISNEGSAFAPVNYRTCGARNSGPVIRLENFEPTIIYSSSESDESEEVKTLSQLQVHTGPTYNSTGGRISPKSLVVSTSGRTVIVGMNFGEMTGSSTEPQDPNTASTSSAANAVNVVNAGTTTKTESPASPSSTANGVEDNKTTTSATATAATTTTGSTEPSGTILNEPNQQANVVDDSDSDVEFVCAKKPPHLRTPEYVELNSDSDSDVVFVNEEFLPIPPPVKVEARIDPNFWNLDMNELNSNVSLFGTAYRSESNRSNQLQDKRRPTKRNDGNEYDLNDSIWEGLHGISKSFLQYKSPASCSLNIDPSGGIDNQPSTSQGARYRRHSRYTKNSNRLKRPADNSNSDDSDSDNNIPLKRLILQKLSKGKNIYEQSSTNSSTGPDSTDAGTSMDDSCESSMSSSSHEEFHLETKRKSKVIKITKQKKSSNKSTEQNKKRTKKTKKRKTKKPINPDESFRKKYCRNSSTHSSTSNDEF